MLEHSIYSVISPEGCASILWRSSAKAAEAAEAQRLTAQDLLKLGVIDEIIPEPLGGAHRQPEAALANIKIALVKSLTSLMKVEGNKLQHMRREKFLSMGTLGL